MNEYILSPAAQADLDQIWDYTADRWSLAQAEKYVREIQAACEAAATSLRPGQAIHDIRSGYRKLSVGSHFLFFRKTDHGVIDIIRILHKRVDIRSHL